MDKYFKSLNSFLTSKVGAFFILLPFVKPAAELTGRFDIFFDLWKLFAAFLIFVGCSRTLHKASWVLYWIISLQATILVSTFINGGDIKAAIVQVVSVTSICIYFDYCLRINQYKAISTLMMPLVFMALLTVATMILYYPEGMYTVGETSKGYVEHQNYLWGFDNSSIFNFIPGMYLMGLYSLMRNRRKTNIIVLIVFLLIAFAFLYVFSITAFLGCFTIVFVFVLLLFLKKRIRFLSTRNLLLIVVVVSLILLIAKDNIKILMDFAIRNDKYFSIKARFNIWNNVINYWKDSPLLGYGIEDKIDLSRKIGIDHPHNFFMDVLYRAGIMGVISIIGLFSNLIRGKWNDSHVNAFSSVVVFVLILISQFDFYNDHYLFYPVLIVAFYSKFFANDKRLNFDAIR